MVGLVFAPYSLKISRDIDSSVSTSIVGGVPVTVKHFDPQGGFGRYEIDAIWR